MNMKKNKIAFLTEMQFHGKVSKENPNLRTEFAWIVALDADHFPLSNFNDVRGYDIVFIIWPKGNAVTNSEGIEIILNKVDNLSKYVDKNIIPTLKQENSLVAYMQEGPSWFFNDYTIVNQIHYYNIMADSDILCVHNVSDISFYRGLFPDKKIFVMQSLMYDDILNKKFVKEDRTIIGGNFCRWYGGFQSYIIASIFENPIDVPSMHNRRLNEEQLGVNHLPYMYWNDWMTNLSKYKYAVHMMPTVAAGTFSMNCAYWSIPCIGNIKSDTQRICFPDLSVDVDDIESARLIALRLKQDKTFYEECSLKAKNNFEKYFSENEFLTKFNDIYE